MLVKHIVDKNVSRAYNMRIKHIGLREKIMSELQDFLDNALPECNISPKKNTEVNKKLANEIIRIRTEQGITQKELALLCGIQQSNISRLENGSYNPSIHLLEKIALAVGKELVIEFI